MTQGSVCASGRRAIAGAVRPFAQRVESLWILVPCSIRGKCSGVISYSHLCCDYRRTRHKHLRYQRPSVVVAAFVDTYNVVDLLHDATYWTYFLLSICFLLCRTLRSRACRLEPHLATSSKARAGTASTIHFLLPPLVVWQVFSVCIRLCFFDGLLVVNGTIVRKSERMLACRFTCMPRKHPCTL